MSRHVLAACLTEQSSKGRKVVGFEAQLSSRFRE